MHLRMQMHFGALVFQLLSWVQPILVQYHISIPPETFSGVIEMWHWTKNGLIWTCEIWGDKAKCSSKRTPTYFTEVVELVFFNLVWFWKSHLISGLRNIKIMFFLHLEKFYLLLATPRVFSGHGSFSLLDIWLVCTKYSFRVL